MANKDALRELQHRLAERLEQAKARAPARNWLAVEAAGQGFLLPLEQAGEVSPLVAFQPVPHSQPWFLGVGNLRGQLHGVVDLAGFLGLPALPASPGEVSRKDAGRLVALHPALQTPTALLVDHVAGLRRPQDMVGVRTTGSVAPHFVTAERTDAQGRSWCELNLAALALDDAFLRVAA